MKIRAAVLNAPKKPFAIEELDLDPPRAGEVLVKLSACGVCHSDWHVANGDTPHPVPVVAGHEGAGVVEQVGEGVIDLQVGDHVVLSWAPNCGTCFYCQRGKQNLCETYTKPIWAGTMLDGTTRLSRTRGGKNKKREPIYSYCGTAAFATHTVVPRVSCVKIPNDVKLDAACLVGCAVATGVGAAMYTANVRAGDSVVVFGLGGVGLSIVQGAKLCGASTIIGVDTTVEKIPVGLHFGATNVVLANDDVEAIVKSHTGGHGTDHVFEAIGVPSVQERAMKCLRPGGTLTLAGLAPVGTATNFSSATIARNEFTIKGSYYGGVNPQRDFPMFIEMYRAKTLNLDDLITKRFTLDQINDAFEEMVAGRTVRGVITFE